MLNMISRSAFSPSRSVKLGRWGDTDGCQLGQVEVNKAKVESMTKSYVPVHTLFKETRSSSQGQSKLGRVSANPAGSLTPGSVDLLVLPEMALSGYIFSTPTSILPYLEPTTSGPTTQLAQALATRIGCTVIAGYPEALPSAPVYQTPVPSTSSASSSSTQNQAGTNSSIGTQVDGGESDMGPKEMKALEGEGLGVGYNSAVIVGPGGKVLGNYRKTFRFDQDKNWAREGESPGPLNHPCGLYGLVDENVAGTGRLADWL